MKRRARASRAECRRTNNAAINLSRASGAATPRYILAGTLSSEAAAYFFCIMRLHVSWIFRGRQTDTPSDRYYLDSDTGCAFLPRIPRLHLGRKIRSQALAIEIDTNTSRCLSHLNEGLQ